MTPNAKKTLVHLLGRVAKHLVSVVGEDPITYQEWAQPIGHPALIVPPIGGIDLTRLPELMYADDHLTAMQAAAVWDRACTLFVTDQKSLYPYIRSVFPALPLHGIQPLSTKNHLTNLIQLMGALSWYAGPLRLTKEVCELHDGDRAYGLNHRCIDATGIHERLPTTYIKNMRAVLTDSVGSTHKLKAYGATIYRYLIKRMPDDRPAIAATIAAGALAGPEYLSILTDHFTIQHTRRSRQNVARQQ